MKELTAEELRRLVKYDPDSGLMTRLVKTSYRISVGDACGNVNAQGYLVARIHTKKRPVHRLAWLYMTGDWPTGEIDHLNGERTDNRWANLRDATDAVNAQNTRRARTDNKSTGLLGVSKNWRGFRARIMVDRKMLHLGTFKTPELAHEAYVKAKRELHEGCVL